MICLGGSLFRALSLGPHVLSRDRWVGRMRNGRASNERIHASDCIFDDVVRRVINAGDHVGIEFIVRNQPIVESSAIFPTCLNVIGGITCCCPHVFRQGFLFVQGLLNEVAEIRKVFIPIEVSIVLSLVSQRLGFPKELSLKGVRLAPRRNEPLPDSPASAQVRIMFVAIRFTVWRIFRLVVRFATRFTAWLAIRSKGIP